MASSIIMRTKFLLLLFNLKLTICFLYRAIRSKQRARRRQNETFSLNDDTLLKILRRVGPSLSEDIAVYEEFNHRFGQIY